MIHLYSHAPLFLFFSFSLSEVALWIPVILMFAGLWKIFEKAGKPGWAAIVPIYGSIVLAEIVRKPIYWAFLMLIPYIGLIWGIWMTNLLVKRFGKDEAFTVGCVLLPFVFLPILGFGDSQYLNDSDSVQV